VASGVMINYTRLFKTDSTRRIDSVIDYFGEAPPGAVGRKAWLTRGPHPSPASGPRETLRDALSRRGA